MCSVTLSSEHATPQNRSPHHERELLHLTPHPHISVCLCGRFVHFVQFFLTRAGENNCHAFTVPSRYQWLISPQKNNALLLASSDKWGTEKSHLGNMPCIDGHSHQASMIKLKDGIALTIALKAIHMYSCILSCFLVFLFTCLHVFLFSEFCILSC